MEHFSFEQRVDITPLNEKINSLKQEIAKVLIAQHENVEMIIIALLSQGHVLLEGMPGVAKTLMIKVLAKAISVEFSRIQFTPDLMPSDVIGTNVFNPKTVTFDFKRGPIFSNLVLIDEINRAPAKTQSALFEVMEERQITVDSTTYILKEPFMILATQNPVEHEGTYNLPEAQLDRFAFKLIVHYPKLDDEIKILQKHQEQYSMHNLLKHVNPILTAADLKTLQGVIQQVNIDGKLLSYIAQIVQLTRSHASIALGASPRASITMLNACKTLAALRGRDFVTPEDIKYIAPSVLRHRISLTAEKEMEGSSTDDIIESMLQQIEIPR